MNLNAVIIANDLALELLISTLQKTHPAAIAQFAAQLDTMSIQTTNALQGDLATEVQKRLSQLAAVATQPTQPSAH